MGCIFFEMLVGTCPFKGMNEGDLLNNIKTKELVVPPDVAVSKVSVEILAKVISTPFPHPRITITLPHPHPRITSHRIAIHRCCISSYLCIVPSLTLSLSTRLVLLLVACAAAGEESQPARVAGPAAGDRGALEQDRACASGRQPPGGADDASGRLRGQSAAPRGGRAGPRRQPARAEGAHQRRHEDGHRCH